MGFWARWGQGPAVCLGNNVGAGVPTQLQGGPDLCGSEKFHELDLIVSLDAHPSLTPQAAAFLVPHSWVRKQTFFRQHHTLAVKYLQAVKPTPSILHSCSHLHLYQQPVRSIRPV